MPTLVQSTGDMIDAFKQQDGSGHLIPVIEQLNDTSQMLMDDWVWQVCNEGTKHTRSVRTGLPSVAWGMLYQGIPQSKGAKQTVSETTGFVESLASIDTRQLDLYAENEVGIRAQEAEPHIEAMAQELLTALFYHNTDTNVQLPKGLSPRFSILGDTGASKQIIDGGGTGSDNTSIWFVEWGSSGVSVIYPKGTTAGITRKNKGEQRVLDANGNPYYVKEEMFKADVGFSLGDYRRVVRIPNIDMSDVKAGTVDLYGLLRKAYYQHHSRRVAKVHNQATPGRVAIYCNKDIAEALDGLATNAGANDSFVRLRPTEIQGQEVMSYRGIPLRETDALLNTEARVQ